MGSKYSVTDFKYFTVPLSSQHNAEGNMKVRLCQWCLFLWQITKQWFCQQEEEGQAAIRQKNLSSSKKVETVDMNYKYEKLTWKHQTVTVGDFLAAI